uniref:Uncharacterized protein n=1 Tax=Knipowitschia caucasica TaxID=637954 RepID=A0AAV2JLL2_KNICA
MGKIQEYEKVFTDTRDEALEYKKESAALLETQKAKYMRQISKQRETHKNTVHHLKSEVQLLQNELDTKVTDLTQALQLTQNSFEQLKQQSSEKIAEQATQLQQKKEKISFLLKDTKLQVKFTESKVREETEDIINNYHPRITLLEKDVKEYKEAFEQQKTEIENLKKDGEQKYKIICMQEKEIKYLREDIKNIKDQLDEEQTLNVRMELKIS